MYGAYVNTDGSTVGEARKLYAGMRIFELAKQARTVKHYIWSNLDYVTKVCLFTSTDRPSNVYRKYVHRIYSPVQRHCRRSKVLVREDAREEIHHEISVRWQGSPHSSITEGHTRNFSALDRVRPRQCQESINELGRDLVKQS